MATGYNEIQLDALRELANIASGTAATALSQLLGREVDINVPRALALPAAEAVEACGDPESTVTGVMLPLEGSMEGVVLLLLGPSACVTLCEILGVDRDSEVGASALAEIGNILGAAYLNALGSMTGLELLPSPPQAMTDLLAAIVATVIAQTVAYGDHALLLDSELDVSGSPCAITFMLLPSSGSADDLLAPLGLSSAS